MRTVVCTRPRSSSLVIWIILSSSSTCRWRARLPSVSAQSCFTSTKLSPSGCVISEVRTLSRARSWITRSRPSYANGAVDLEFLFFIGRGLLCGKVVDRSDQRHANRIGAGHRRRSKSANIPKSDARESGEQKPRARQQHRARQTAAGSEDTQGEYDLPQTRQHPEHIACDVQQYKRKNRTCNTCRKELRHSRPDHFVCHPRMQSPGTRKHLGGNEGSAQNRS